MGLENNDPRQFDIPICLQGVALDLSPAALSYLIGYVQMDGDISNITIGRHGINFVDQRETTHFLGHDTVERKGEGDPNPIAVAIMVNLPILMERLRF